METKAGEVRVAEVEERREISEEKREKNGSKESGRRVGDLG